MVLVLTDSPRYNLEAARSPQVRLGEGRDSPDRVDPEVEHLSLDGLESIASGLA